MSEPVVRETETGDVPAVRRIARAGWEAAYGDVLDAATIDAAVSEWYAPGTIRESIEREEVVHRVAECECEENVIGYVSGGPDTGEVAVLGAIYVDPDRWGEGVGTALLSAFEAACRERGCSELRFRVLADNEVGVSFYRARGYEAVEESEVELFGERVSELTFRGPL